MNFILQTAFNLYVRLFSLFHCHARHFQYSFIYAAETVLPNLMQISFYVAIILLVAALIKRIPYCWFAKLHILIVPSYLALVWHTIVLANFAYWSQPLGWLLIAALLAGIACSLIALFKRIGNPQNATVSALNQNVP